MLSDYPKKLVSSTHDKVIANDDDEYEDVLHIRYNNMSKWIAYNKSCPKNLFKEKTNPMITVDLKMGIFVNNVLQTRFEFIPKKILQPNWKITGPGTIEIPKEYYHQLLSSIKLLS